MGRSTTGRNLVLLALASLASGIVIRMKCRASDPTPPLGTPDMPSPRDAAVSRDAAPDAPPIDAVELDAIVDAPVVHTVSGLQIGAISADRKRALLVVPDGSRETPRFRVVLLETGAIETDLVLPSLDLISDGKDPDAVVALAKAREILHGFPLGAHVFGNLASSDGTRGAINIGDPLWIIDGDKLRSKLPFPAAYHPLALPDGKTLLVQGYDGRIGDQGKYSIFSVPLGGGKPKKIVGTDAATGEWAFTDTTLHIIVSQPPTIPTCVVDIDIVTLKATKRGCLDGGDASDLDLSPSGSRVVWTAFADGKSRIRSMDLATNTIEFDAEQRGFVRISDGGNVLIAGFDHAQLWDVKTRTQRPVEGVSFECLFVSDDVLACPDGNSAHLVSVAP